MGQEEKDRGAKAQAVLNEHHSPSGTAMGTYICDGLDRPGLNDTAVLSAMSRVARHRFVPDEAKEYAYEDMALPIGLGQTISQPFIVALMTQEARVKPEAKVLEIGTGSGYQAAVLAELKAHVFTIEIVPELARRAEALLKELGYNSVSVREGDGFRGWPEEAPFSAIIVTAASPGYPSALLAQLAEGGRLIIPVEDKYGAGETLMAVERKGDRFFTEDLGAVRFVPLTGDVRKHKKDVLRKLKGPFKLNELAERGEGNHGGR